MKAKNWILVLLILLSGGVFYGYRMLEAMRVDNEAPEITVHTQMPEFSVQDDKSLLTQGLTARDDRDGDVTDSLVVEHITLLDRDGTISVDYAAFDAAGNVAKITREARYTDYISPRFVLSTPLCYTEGTVFDVLSTIGAVDVVEGDIQHRVRAMLMNEEPITDEGIHQVQFQVSNSLGDTTTEILPVEVYDGGDYSARLELKEYLIYLPAGSTFVPENYLLSFARQDMNRNLEAGLPRDFSLKTKGTVQTQYPGVYPVEFRVTYIDRHETNPNYDREYTGYSKMIVIVEG